MRCPSFLFFSTRTFICTAPSFEGIRDVAVQHDSVSFLYSGDTNALVRSLARMKFDDITIEDPDLEDVFMHYYASEVK